jgi:predicted DNA-binding transcriptional regulator AlpA
MTDIRPLLTPSQVAEILGVTVGTLSIWRCVHRYDLPYKKIGRLVKYESAAVAAFIARHNGPCDPPAPTVNPDMKSRTGL